MRQREIDPRQAHAEMLQDPAIPYVDVRTPAEFAAGHPEGAYNIPILLSGMLGMKPNPEFVAACESVLSKEAPVLLGCKSGQRSAMACQVLAQAGFQDVTNVAGGFSGSAIPGWAQCGLPSSTTPQPGRSWDEIRSKG